MNLGFVGTGKIASSVIAGVCNSKIAYNKIIISPRNKNIAKKLKKKFKKVIIAKDNQQIVDNCDWIFLAITPTVGKKIIKDLKFKPTQTIISLISTMTLFQLRKAIKIKSQNCKSYTVTSNIIEKGPSSYLPSKSKSKSFL